MGKNGFLDKVNDNLQVVSEILRGTVKKKFWFRYIVEGKYKERDAIFRYECGGTNREDVIIIPKKVLPKQKKFLFTYPKPTRHTQLCGNKIRWFKFSLIDNFANWTRQDIIEVFEELTRAAEIVETDDTFYRN